METVTGSDQPNDSVLSLYTTEHEAHLQTVHRLADLIAMARASVAAAHRGDENPVCWVEGWLDKEGLLPEPGAVPEQIAVAPLVTRGAK